MKPAKTEATVPAVRQPMLPTALLAAAMTLALSMALVLLPSPVAASPSGLAAAQECGTVVVQFPEGSGGADGIEATGIKCKRAREVARSCVDVFDDDTAIEGWTVVTWTRTLMTKGDKRISYLPVGGGGCGELPVSCDDFGYEGVGFFNPKALGLTCKKARKKAKAWYDAGSPPCGFGRTCEIGKYKCEGDSETGTVSCVRRENGYRFTWEMGE